MKYLQTGEYCNQVEIAAWGEKNPYIWKKEWKFFVSINICSYFVITYKSHHDKWLKQRKVVSLLNSNSSKSQNNCAWLPLGMFIQQVGWLFWANLVLEASLSIFWDV